MARGSTGGRMLMFLGRKLGWWKDRASSSVVMCASRTSNKVPCLYLSNVIKLQKSSGGDGGYA